MDNVMTGSIASNIVWEMPRDCWPTPQHECLLRAALLEGDEAMEAWQEWRKIQDIEAVDFGSFRLLPLLYKNLLKLGVEDPEIKRLKGVYRLSWVKNQIVFNQGVKLLNEFHEMGVKTMALKGVALSLKYYEDMGIRPMADFDVLIPSDKAKQVTDYLLNGGWTPKDPLSLYMDIYHGCGFANESGYEVDVHWHMMDESCFPGGDDPFWDGAVPLNINGFPTLALNPADQLFHVCGHGVRWSILPPIRWIADAQMIIKTTGNDMDWDRIVQHAEKYRMISSLATGFTYIKRLLNLEIPASVLRALSDLPVSRMDRITFKERTRNLNVVSPIPAMWNHYVRHARMAGNVGTSRKLLSFPGYLKDLWGLKRTWHVPCYFITKGTARMINIVRYKLGMPI